MSLKSDRGDWTRVNRTNPSERSIIDYLIGTQKIAKQVSWLEIDEEGSIRIKGKKESDHNTISLELQIETQISTSRVTVWNVKDKEGWEKYNEEMLKENERNPPEMYSDLERNINIAMQRSIGKITITRGKVKRRENEKTKRLKQEKKEAKKNFNKACKNKSNDRAEKLEIYV